MDEHERDAVTTPKKTRVSPVTSIGDFFNTLKAFIGTNYLALPFAFAQSGLILGIVGVFLIATLTDHCCQLLIKCKYTVIDRLVDEQTALRPLSAQELRELRQKLERSVSYGDVGRISLGRVCELVINVTVVFTQFLTCVCYFIFIGNAIYTIFPKEAAWVPLGNSSAPINAPQDPRWRLVNGVPLLSIENIPSHLHDHRVRRSLPWEQAEMSFSSDESMQNFSALFEADTTTTTMTTTTIAPNVTTTVPSTNTTTMVHNVTTSPTPSNLVRSLAPSLMFLVMIPAPFFLLTSLIRSMRVLSPLTFIATLFLFLGAFAVLTFLCIDFSIVSTLEWAKYATLPIFLGQLISAYEGIGCILPIESSMEGNRHIFPAFLHLAIYMVFAILTAFGILGYLRYGDGVQQIIILSIPQSSILAKLVDATLIVSVLFTYPLQMFPVIQIIEAYLFGPGMCCSPEAKRGQEGRDDLNVLINEDNEDVMERSIDSHVSQSGHEVAVQIPASVPRWKRDILRIFIQLLAMGCGILMREAYAYVSAFAGAMGASLLAFILPCAMHIQLRRHELSLPIIIKDLCIIFLSVICSIFVIVIIIYKCVRGEGGI